MAETRKRKSLAPSGPLKLDTLANVRTEMARLYRLGLTGKAEPDTMTKFIYALREIRGCIEAQLLEDVQQRLQALADKVEARNGR